MRDEEHLLAERSAGTRHEFHRGRVSAWAGGTVERGRLAAR
jgi:hypothetical protein